RAGSGRRCRVRRPRGHRAGGGCAGGSGPARAHGPTSPLYFALSTVLLLVFAVGFTLMAGRVRDAGAFYAYVQAGLGRIPGLSAATLALFSYTLLLVGVNAYVGVATSNVIERYADVGSPWWAWALVSLGVIAFLGYRDIELSAKVLGAVLVLEFLLLLVMDVGIVGHGGARGLTAEPVSPSIVGTGSLGLGVMFALFGFIGFEATAVFRNEAKDPDVTVPRATYVAILPVHLVPPVRATPRHFAPYEIGHRYAESTERPERPCSPTPCSTPCSTKRASRTPASPPG
ncbi:APC family permease, partial [Streptomyces sp. NPDC006324]|uniref:APC family permease n=1 Tax=Streptomyces sp. NPDC006324 TaxID=3156751 RepID=UPI0033A45675